MSMRTIASLGCKILGIFSIIRGLNGSGDVLRIIFVSDTNQPGTLEIITRVASFLLPVIFGLSIWYFSDKLSGIMVKEDAHSNIGLVTKGDEIQRIAFSVVGLYFIVNSSISLVHLIINILILPKFFSPNLIGYLGSSVIELIIALVIFFGSQGLVNLLNAVRSLGLRRSKNKEGKE